jgi:hypothetical protein
MRNIGDLKKHFGQIVNKAKSLIPQRGQQPPIPQSSVQQDEILKVPEEEAQSTPLVQQSEISSTKIPAIRMHRALLEAVANRNVEGIRKNAEQGGDVHFQKDLPLRNAVSLGYRDVIEVLLQLGADVHAEGETPLYTAVRLRDFDLAERLILEGADVDKMTEAQADLIDRDFMKSLDDMHARNGKAVFEQSYAATRKTYKKPAFKSQKQQGL